MKYACKKYEDQDMRVQAKMYVEAVCFAEANGCQNVFDIRGRQQAGRVLLWDKAYHYQRAATSLFITVGLLHIDEIPMSVKKMTIINRVAFKAGSYRDKAAELYRQAAECRAVSPSSRIGEEATCTK